MRNCIRGFASATLFAVANTFLSFSVDAQQIPQQLQPPANEQLLLQVHAKGDQVYTCKGDATQFAWTLKAPDAQLFDNDGKPFGKHFAGPSWEPTTAAVLPAKPLPMLLPRTPILFPGFSSTSSATMATVCSRAPPPFSASTPKAAKHPRPVATLRTSARNSA